MDEVYLNRAHQADLEIRGDGRTVVGIAVPFDAPTPIRDASGSYTELFRRGAFAKTISERGDRVKFLAQHDRRAMPLGRATLLREDAAGLYAEFRVSQTRDGDDALALIRDGALDALSIGFRPVKDVWNRDRSMVERTEARLDEVSAVSFPAYDGALIAGVRTAATDLSDLIAALIDDPEALALLARSLPVLGSSAPDAADPGSFAMLHDGRDYRLFLRRLGDPRTLYQAAWVAGTPSYRFGHRSIDTIPVTGFPDDTDWSRWSTLHDGAAYRLYTGSHRDPDLLYQGAFNVDAHAYQYGHRSIPRLTLEGGPGPLHGLAMLHDGADYRAHRMR